MFPKSFSHLTTATALATALSAAPGLMSAETFTAHSLLQAVTLYPSAATLTREATLTLPAGAHTIVLEDIPAGQDVSAITSSLQTMVTGGTPGPVSYRLVPVPNTPTHSLPLAKSAFAQVEALEAELREAEREIAAIGFEAQAAEDTLAYLARLGTQEGADRAAMTETAQMIREQSLEARLAAADARARAAEKERGLKEVQEALEKAKAELERISTREGQRLSISFSLDVPQEQEVKIALRYMIDTAYWHPLYTATLDTESGSLSMTRGVKAVQTTGEAWDQVDLTFATDNPSRRAEPMEVFPEIRRIEKPQEMLQKNMRIQMDDAAGYGAPIEAMMGAEPMAELSIRGLNQSYHYPTPTSLLSDATGAEFKLSDVALTPEIVVRVVPLFDTSGYLIAGFTNETGEMLVPGPVRLIRDGASLGETSLGTVVDGADAELSFGAIDAVTVERVVLDRNEGDRGMISKSTERTSNWRIKVENLTARAWPIEVIDRVSVSEQADLKIDWSASPKPDVENMEDKRGVMAWHFDLPAGAAQEITMQETLRWPEGMELR